MCNTHYVNNALPLSDDLMENQEDKRQRGKNSSRPRLDRLAKGEFVKVRSMAWGVWIHACSYRFLGSGYGFEGFHGCIAKVFLLNNTW